MTDKLVLLRHGQSLWNLENRFTGWMDVDLSERGIVEAKTAGQALRRHGFTFDMAFTSILKRSIRTLNIVLDELDATDLIIVKDWHLNERHYGSLQGLNKAEMTQIHGEAQVHQWRRGFDIRPPALSLQQVREMHQSAPFNDLDYVPPTESLADTFRRVVNFWNDSIAPTLRSGSRIIVAAHGNSLRALVKYLDHIPDDKITSVNIPTGIPLVYELNADLSPSKSYYLADDAALQSAMAEVKNQIQADRS